MEKVNFNYSLKNIPLPTKDTYWKNLIHKLERFIKKIRWKAFFFENKNEFANEITTNFGFKSVTTPSKNDQFNQFESDLYDMVQNFEFKKVTSNFQARLSDDARNIKKNPKFLISADKTNNFYELTTDEYNKLLTENISKTYKKSNLSTMHTINAEAKIIVQDLKIDDSI